MLFSKDELKLIIKEAAKEIAAQIYEASVMSPFSVQSTTSVDLTTARTETNALEIGFPFKAIWFKNATDNSVKLKIKFNKNDASGSGQYVEVVGNDILASDKMYSKAYVYWEAQSGKSIDWVVFTDTVPQTGSLINSGTVSVARATSATLTNPAVSASTATSILAANTSRKTAHIQNVSGASVFIGFANTVSNSGSTKGLEITNGGYFKIENTAQIYAYSVGAIAAGGLTIIEET